MLLEPALQAIPETAPHCIPPLVNGVTPIVSRQLTGINFINLNVPQWAAAEAEFKQWFHANIVQ